MRDVFDSANFDSQAGQAKGILHEGSGYNIVAGAGNDIVEINSYGAPSVNLVSAGEGADLADIFARTEGEIKVYLDISNKIVRVSFLDEMFIFVDQEQLEQVYLEFQPDIESEARCFIKFYSATLSVAKANYQ